ncbi:hypothetical protein [Streptomyces capitiformicae]|uniref:Uncharacterized protein n=1 Tax=Streptomyces capitiformicae TaxID=2014920 RepID=A0A919GNN9_9ACTN|nr:hypothetical protein [Streptomyces capitiformicae]GHH87907.1 hypothetical protein GCM10017771_31010 [Streptomyces capitiformicae]
MTAHRQPPNHNTLTCYTDYRCRLPECVDRYRQWDRARYRAKASGEPGRYVDAEPVRQHLLKLYAAGITIHAVAAATGLSYLAVRSFTHHEYGNRRSRRQRCTTTTQAKLLAVTPDNITTGRIDATGTIRRVQALVAIGFPLERIAPHTVLSVNNMSALLQRKTVLASTASSVADAYELLRNRKPARHGVDKRNISRATKRAAANRWPTPTYWDRHPGAIDDPDFEPLYGVTRREIVAQDANWIMRTTGVSKATAAARLGVSKAYVEHAFRDHPEYALEVAA